MENYINRIVLARQRPPNGTRQGWCLCKAAGDDETASRCSWNTLKDIKEAPLKSICDTLFSSGAFRGRAVDGVPNKSMIKSIDGTPMDKLM
jgi:hypothetical protein